MYPFQYFMNNFLHHFYTTLLDDETRLWLYKQRHRDEYRKLRHNVYPSDKGNFSLKPYDKYQCIFIHITKTAGTSIAKSLFNYLPYHYTAIDYRVIYGKKAFNHYYKFAFVRNPWDRLYSAYRYLKAGGWNDNDQQWAAKNISKFDNFNNFVINWLTSENIKHHIHFKPQHEFICDRKGNILLDYLAYFETINKDFDKIINKLNLNVQLEKHNINLGSNYLNIYQPESIERVRQVYSHDIELFGYEFDHIEKRNIVA